MTEPVKHGFAGIKLTSDGLYYGACVCGHTDTPVVDKDQAWFNSTDHFMELPEFRRLLGASISDVRGEHPDDQ